MDDEKYTLVNFLSFNYIPDELKEKCYNSLKRDIYYYSLTIMSDLLY